MSLSDTTDAAAFEATLAAEGYTVVKRSLAPAEGLDGHAHDWAAWGLVTEGVFRITVDGETTDYGAGRQFRLEPGCTHSEVAGPDGCSLVVGRLYR